MEKIIIETTVMAPSNKVWSLFTIPAHITQWSAASDDWHTTKAENDVREGGRFSSRMEAKDGSFGFDFSGTYTLVKEPHQINYTLDDNRKVEIKFTSDANSTRIVQAFEPEQTNPKEMQQMGWQAILDNFKKYVEQKGPIETLHFEIKIDAPSEKVFRLMTEEKSYNEWTAMFNETSRFEGSWGKGSKIHFLGTDNEGKTGGMVSRIKENIPNQFISIEHLGEIKDGIEIMSGSGVEAWAGSLENYSFVDNNGATLLKVDLDSNAEFKDYFEGIWPKALEKLKEICER
ncbi:MAG: SRPBCC family protein [Bacteroidota bacterium]